MSAKQEKRTTTAAARTVSLNELGVTASEKRVAPEGFARWVRAILQNRRQGTVGCKGRSDVSLTNKKPWKQKGTGRARAGSARSPLWRGGGVIFGPQMRERQLTVSKKSKRAVLAQLLQEQATRGGITLLQWLLESERPKTALAHAALKSAGLAGKKVTIFLPFNDSLVAASFANIPNVRLLSFDEPNAFDLAVGGQWVVLERDLDKFKDMVSRWS